MFEVLQKKNVNFFIIKKIFIFNSKNNNKQNKLQKCVIKQKYNLIHTTSTCI